MSISEQTLVALQTFMALDKALMAQVQATNDAAHAAALIAPAAAKQGITVNEAELIAHLEVVSASLTNQALSDQQLEAVAGGFANPFKHATFNNDDEKFTFVSIASLGMGCAIVSIGHAAGDMMGFTKKFC